MIIKTIRYAHTHPFVIVGQPKELSDTSSLMLQDLIDRWQYRPAASSRLLWLWVCGVLDICLATAGGRLRCRSEKHIRMTQSQLQILQLDTSYPTNSYNKTCLCAQWIWMSCWKTSPTSPQARFLTAIEGWAGRYPGWAFFSHHIII